MSSKTKLSGKTLLSTTQISILFRECLSYKDSGLTLLHVKAASKFSTRSSTAFTICSTWSMDRWKRSRWGSTTLELNLFSASSRLLRWCVMFIWGTSTNSESDREESSGKQSVRTNTSSPFAAFKFVSSLTCLRSLPVKSSGKIMILPLVGMIL